MNVSMTVLTLVVLLPPGLFILAVILESWMSRTRDHDVVGRAESRLRHPSSPERTCPDCHIGVRDPIVHTRYCVGGSRGR